MKKLRLAAVGITHLTDARYFAAQDVDFLAFPVDPVAPPFLEPAFVKELKGWVSVPQFFGIFSGLMPQDALSILQDGQLDGAILSPAYSANDAARFDGPIGLFASFSSARDLETLLTHELVSTQTAAFALLKPNAGLQPEEQVLDRLRQLCAQIPVYLTLEPEAVAWKEIPGQLPFFGLALVGSEETAIGEKDFSLYDSLLETHLAEDF